MLMRIEKENFIVEKNEEYFSIFQTIVWCRAYACMKKSIRPKLPCYLCSNARI